MLHVNVEDSPDDTMVVPRRYRDFEALRNDVRLARLPSLPRHDLAAASAVTSALWLLLQSLHPPRPALASLTPFLVPALAAHRRVPDDL